MDLESKGANRKLKMEILEQLHNSLEDVIMQEREQDLKMTIIQSIQALDNLNLPDITYRGRVFEGIGRWLICFLGSLRGVSDLNVQSIDTSPNVNIIIILLSEEHISKYQRNRLKELVRSTRQGGFMIIRGQKTTGYSFERQIDQAILKLKSALQSLPSKPFPLLQEQIRF